MTVVSIISFDPGMNLGWAQIGLFTTLSAPIHLRASGLNAYDSEIPITRRIELQKEFIHNIIRNSPSETIVAVESVNRVFGGVKNSNSDALYRIYGHIHDAAYSLDRRIVDMPITTVKSTFADKGSAKKQQMISAATKAAGLPITNDNEADAIGIGWTLAQLLLDSVENPKSKGKESEFRTNIRLLAEHLGKRP